MTDNNDPSSISPLKETNPQSLIQGSFRHYSDFQRLLNNPNYLYELVDANGNALRGDLGPLGDTILRYNPREVLPYLLNKLLGIRYTDSRQVATERNYGVRITATRSGKSEVILMSDHIDSETTRLKACRLEGTVWEEGPFGVAYEQVEMLNWLIEQHNLSYKPALPKLNKHLKIKKRVDGNGYTASLFWRDYQIEIIGNCQVGFSCDVGNLRSENNLDYFSAIMWAYHKLAFGINQEQKKLLFKEHLYRLDYMPDCQPFWFLYRIFGELCDYWSQNRPEEYASSRKGPFRVRTLTKEEREAAGFQRLSVIPRPLSPEEVRALRTSIYASCKAMAIDECISYIFDDLFAALAVTYPASEILKNKFVDIDHQYVAKPINGDEAALRTYLDEYKKREGFENEMDEEFLLFISIIRFVEGIQGA